MHFSFFTREWFEKWIENELECERSPVTRANNSNSDGKSVRASLIFLEYSLPLILSVYLLHWFPSSLLHFLKAINSGLLARHWRFGAQGSSPKARYSLPTTFLSCCHRTRRWRPWWAEGGRSSLTARPVTLRLTFRHETVIFSIDKLSYKRLTLRRSKERDWFAYKITPNLPIWFSNVYQATL